MRPAVFSASHRRLHKKVAASILSLGPCLELALTPPLKSSPQGRHHTTPSPPSLEFVSEKWPGPSFLSSVQGH